MCNEIEMSSDFDALRTLPFCRECKMIEWLFNQLKHASEYPTIVQAPHRVVHVKESLLLILDENDYFATHSNGKIEELPRDLMDKTNWRIPHEIHLTELNKFLRGAKLQIITNPRRVQCAAAGFENNLRGYGRAPSVANTASSTAMMTDISRKFISDVEGKIVEIHGESKLLKLSSGEKQWLTSTNATFHIKAKIWLDALEDVDKYLELLQPFAAELANQKLAGNDTFTFGMEVEDEKLLPTDYESFSSNDETDPKDVYEPSTKCSVEERKKPRPKKPLNFTDSDSDTSDPTRDREEKPSKEFAERAITRKVTLSDHSPTLVTRAFAGFRVVFHKNDFGEDIVPKFISLERTMAPK